MYLRVFLDDGSKSWIFLTLKAPITTAADDIYKYFFAVFFFFSEKIRFGVSSESSARQRQMIHLKHQTLFSSKEQS